MTNPIPAEAVEAAARALCVVTNYGTLGPRCDTHEWVVLIKDPTHCEYGDEIARAALTAAAPLIAAQERTTASAMTELFKAEHEKNRDLCDGIAALRDEFRSEIDWSDGRSNYGDNAAWERAANALDALLREA